MSFYGNIINYLSNKFAFKRNQEDSNQVIFDLKDTKNVLTFVGSANKNNQNGIYFDVNKTDNSVTLCMDTTDLQNSLAITLEEYEQNNDDQLIYALKQGANEIGRINIPLALILESGEITTTNDKNESGVFLHLTLRTSEFGSKDVYINVKDLNEIAGEDTDTIKIEVDSQQRISAKVLNNSIKTEHLAEKAITTEKFATDAKAPAAIVSDKVAKNLTITINNEQIEYDGSIDKSFNVDTAIKTQIEELNVTDEAKPNQVVTSVSEVNGKILVTRNSISYNSLTDKPAIPVDTNTAHTHENGLGTLVSETGGISGKVKVDLNIEFGELKNNKIELIDKVSKEVISYFEIPPTLSLENYIQKSEAVGYNDILTNNTAAQIYMRKDQFVPGSGTGGLLNVIDDGNGNIQIIWTMEEA